MKRNLTDFLQDIFRGQDLEYVKWFNGYLVSASSSQVKLWDKESHTLVGTIHESKICLVFYLFFFPFSTLQLQAVDLVYGEADEASVKSVLFGSGHGLLVSWQNWVVLHNSYYLIDLNLQQLV